jgi:hypothetical protein
MEFYYKNSTEFLSVLLILKQILLAITAKCSHLAMRLITELRAPSTSALDGRDL